MKQNNLQAFIDKSLDDVLPKFRQCAKYLQGFYLTFSTLLMILHKISKIAQKRMGQYKNNVFSRQTYISIALSELNQF